MSESAYATVAVSDSAEIHLRGVVSRLLAETDLHRLIQSARLLLQASPGARTYKFLRKTAASAQTAGLALKPLKVALLSTFSIEFLHDALIAHGLASGLAIEVYQTGFGTYAQELSDRTSGLYRAAPDIVFLAVEGSDALPEIYGEIAAGDRTRASERFYANLTGWLGRFRECSTAPLVVHNLAPVGRLADGLLASRDENGQSRLIGRLNERLADFCRQHRDLHLLDYAQLVASHGLAHWYDHRMRLFAHAPISGSGLGELAREYVKYCRARAGLVRKCLVVDLDNTLWGGVVGEDGEHGVRLGPTYPGSAFVEFQRSLRGLRERGVLLAIASKNNAADALQVLADHPHCVLRPGDFADIQINWEAKHESLQRIARKLDIGFERIVFVDDNPAECEQVRVRLPSVAVVQLPLQPERYVEALHADGWFDGLVPTADR